MPTATPPAVPAPAVLPRTAPRAVRAEGAAGDESVPARLSREALEHAQLLVAGGVDCVTARLYAFGRIPLSPRWSRRFPDADAVADGVGMGRAGRNLRRLEGWTASRRERQEGWLSWSRRTGDAPGRGALVWKLYLSPAPDALPAAFDALPAVLADSAAFSLKVGSSACGVLRPDKLVIYFRDRAALHHTAARLGQALAGCPAHGVPFTAALTADGLLSWGLDPAAAPGAEPESWRVWVVTRLAAALVEARGAAPRTPPAAYALRRIRALGVSAGRWEPPAWMQEGRPAPDPPAGRRRPRALPLSRTAEPCP